MSISPGLLNRNSLNTMVRTLYQTGHELMNLPLWGQFMLIGVLLLVGRFWFSQIAGRLSAVQWTGSRMSVLLKCLSAALLLAFLLVNFWLGTSPTGQRYEWGLYGRGAFIGLTLFLTQFLTRFFAR